jgi:RNA polymerase sigma-70 factor, ECF subfamily
MISDERLMLEFQSGSREAFAELFARYRRPLYRFFGRRLSDNGRAEDLMQETFLALIRATTRYEPRALVRTYLYGIAMNLLLAERRRIQRNSGNDTNADPSTNGACEEVLWLRQAMARLDGGDREVLMLREYEQLSYAEIAELTRAPVNTVRSRLFRARMALREALEGKTHTNDAGAWAPVGAKDSAMASTTQELGSLPRTEREAI